MSQMFNHDVIHILSKEELKQPSRSLERRQKLEQIVRQRASYEDMAKRSLGMPWMELTDAERREFAGLFVQLLCDMFAGRIDVYADEQVLYLTEQLEKNFAEVRTRLSDQKMEALLDFWLAEKSGHWYAYDVVIDGSSIVDKYHAQVTSILRHHSYPDLVNKMKEKHL